ncbi:hypothetical protein LAJ19_10440 [Deinococcus taeanensis]|uniref:hypothetical protein n=1 Tax=Deinococcus taeanensis TaxID=2737050 RepID=UPI001CDBDCC1|nr:hypothetical protein [Deinococcus taeanensis]UBV42050.1 hypothetical protein LAJ19_10440 [Deinococcus taeanensis]
MTDNRYGDTPLGKSVEEIEQEGGNLVNDARQGEAVRRDEAPVVPAVSTLQGSGVIAALRPGDLIERGSGAEDGTASTNRDSSENS